MVILVDIAQFGSREKKMSTIALDLFLHSTFKSDFKNTWNYLNTSKWRNYCVVIIRVFSSIKNPKLPSTYVKSMTISGNRASYPFVQFYMSPLFNTWNLVFSKLNYLSLILNWLVPSNTPIVRICSPGIGSFGTFPLFTDASKRCLFAVSFIDRYLGCSLSPWLLAAIIRKSINFSYLK